MFKELVTAIYDMYGSSGLPTVLTGLSFQQAGQDATSPYGVFSLDGLSSEDYMGDRDDAVHQAEIRLQLFSSAEDGGVEILDLQESVRQAFDWSTLSISGWQFVKMERESIAPLIYTDEIWQATLIYSVWFTKNR